MRDIRQTDGETDDLPLHNRTLLRIVH